MRIIVSVRCLFAGEVLHDLASEILRQASPQESG
jgi:hypothetical protein